MHDDDDQVSIDWDDIPDILHKWLEFESAELQAYLINEDFDQDIFEVLPFQEAVFLILYLCSTYEIDVSLTFPDGGGITIRGGEEE